MELSISINANHIHGPYGGVNQFAANLENMLLSKGHKVCRNLKPHLDLILIVSSKYNPVTTSYTHDLVKDYLTVHPNTIVVQRINTCDEPRGTDLGLGKAYLEVNKLADHTVFVSEYIRDVYYSLNFDQKKSHNIILNGVDELAFNPSGQAARQPGEKMRIVTHHWSNNFMKGFDFYERFDLLLATKPFQDLFEFTIIGNYPPGMKFRNTSVFPPLEGEALAREIKTNHAYLTGARFEAGGNHYVEAMRCGLPVLYLESGSTGEYCAPFGGIGFSPINFEEKLIEMHSRYEELHTQVKKCFYTAKWMADQYEEIFLNLVTKRRMNSIKHPGMLTKLYYLGKNKGRRITALTKGFFRRLLFIR